MHTNAAPERRKQQFSFGPFMLDEARYTLHRNQHRVRLSPALTRLLLLFVSSEGRLVTREEIAGVLWRQSEYVDVTTGINTAINRVRAALGDNSSVPIYIETVVGLGYRFMASVETEHRPGDSAESMTNLPPVPDAIATALQGSPEASENAGPPLEEISPPRFTPASSVPAVSARGWSLMPMMTVLLLAAVVIPCVLLLRRPRKPPEPLPEPPTFSQATFMANGDEIQTSVISHDGRSLAFSQKKGISVRALDRKVDRLLDGAPGLRVIRLAWLPGEKSLLVSGRNSQTGEHQVWIVSLGADLPKLLLRNAGDAAPAPDGSRLVFTRSSGSQLWIADVDGGGERLLLSEPLENTFSDPFWFPGGKVLCVQKRGVPNDGARDFETDRKAEWELASVSADTGHSIDSLKAVLTGSASIDANGRIFFVESGPNDQPTAVLSMVRTDPQTGRFLSEPSRVEQLSGKGALSISASDDGTVLAALLVRNSAQVYVAQNNPSEPSLAQVRSLLHSAPDNYPHAWTPDGQAVLFESDDDGKYCIYQQKIDGSPARQLIRSEGGAVYPQITPDGKWILFYNLSNFHPNAIYRIPLSGGEIQRVPTRGVVPEYTCPVGGKGSCIIRRSSERGLHFYQFDPINGQGEELGKIGWMETVFGDWSLSPDGTTIAIPIYDPAAPGVRAVKLLPRRPPVLTDIPIRDYGRIQEATWAADGKGLYIEASGPTSFKLLYVTLAGDVTVLRSTAGPTWGVPSRNGSALAFVDYEQDTNVWIGKSP